MYHKMQFLRLHDSCLQKNLKYVHEITNSSSSRIVLLMEGITIVQQQSVRSGGQARSV